ncbi:uncharacterized protein N7482_001874 [Penicillium canariense]|uniref:Uncharacterized protein n=1 Tax=Penicillium canariense TaxID=189055 RepID=A0A9W9LUL4_9EURO|nr:uncharacterized protein N7482_001874 [Penicillium canariense]KAJ5175997.1 hypothetical protein N7482_001874 [Penicillium canariense]
MSRSQMEGLSALPLPLKHGSPLSSSGDEAPALEVIPAKKIQLKEFQAFSGSEGKLGEGFAG